MSIQCSTMSMVIESGPLKTVIGVNMHFLDFGVPFVDPGSKNYSMLGLSGVGVALRQSRPSRV